jgi:hypothetical protein
MVPSSSRDYRKDFGRAYKYLYQEGNLCYLTEVFDTAQEGIQCLWVNGEKYSFSKEKQRITIISIKFWS